MQNRSNLWKTLAASGNVRMETSVTIGERVYAPGSFVTVERAAGQTALSCGNCVSASARFSLAPVENVEIPRTSAAVVKCRFTDGARVSEWLTVGAFYVTRRQNNPVNGLLEFEGYDAMQKANAPYPNLAGFPKAMNSAVMEIARNMGVEVDGRTWDNIPTGGGYYVPLPADGEKMIKILGYIGGVCGGNWVITPRGRLRLVPFVSASGATEAVDKVNVAAIMSGITTGGALTVTGVEAATGSKRVFTGSDAGGIVSVPSNPYATQTLVNALLTRYDGLSYVPFEIKSAIYDPAAEIGDYIVSRSDVAGVVYQESARYGPAFRGDLSAPFAPETLETERSMTDSISDSGAVAEDLSVRFYKFVNQSAATIGDGQSAEIINFDFAAGAGQDAVFHAEIKHTTETTETGDASTGWTYGDAVLTVTYYINGAEVAAYHPTKTETDGANLLHLTYHFTNGKYNAGNFRVTLSLSGGSVTIAAGDARAHIIGQGYSGSDTAAANWVTEDGLVFVGAESYPNKMNYAAGETLDLTGLVVKAYYADETERDVTSDCVVTPANGAELELGENVVSVSYTENGAEFSDSFSVYCESNRVIFIEATQPTTAEYFPGETLDLTGVIVTAIYENETETDVTSECVFTPANGTTLTGEETIIVNAAYTENGETFTAYFEVNVKAIRITSYPLKSDYAVGDTLDYTGLEVMEAVSDGVTRDITSECVLLPPDGTLITEPGDIMVDVRHDGQSLGTFWAAVTIKDIIVIGDYWTLYETGVLSIHCVGNMPSGTPWKEYKEQISEVIIEDGVTSISYHAFVEHRKMKSVTIPDSVKAIGSEAFEGCGGLTSVTIPVGITGIGRATFYNCRSLVSVTIPESVENIGQDAFSGCDSLTNITIPFRVRYISAWTFSGCSNLTSITIPRSVTGIGMQAFFMCDRLRDVYYGGTKSQWDAMRISDTGNECLTSASIHYNSSGPT